MFSDRYRLQDVHRATAMCALCNAERPKWFVTVDREVRLDLCDDCVWDDVEVAEDPNMAWVPGWLRA